MDLLITLLFALCMGTIRVVTNKSPAPVRVVTEDGLVYEQSVSNNIPVGSNIGKKKEFRAFEKILEEFDLVR